MDAFERLKKERERESETVNVRNNGADMAPNYSAPLQNQKNIYSGNNYQNRDTTYENQLLMTKTTMKDIEPDIGATRFMEGKPIRTRDDGPSNNPTLFSNLNPINNLEDAGDTLASLFKSTANLRGENTTREFENNDVSDRFSKLRTQYKQDGKLDRPQDASNKVEDVIGKRLSAPSQMTPSAVRNYDSAVSGEKPIMETFLINEAPERIAEENRRNAEKELILSNQLSNNAYLNYGLIPPKR